MPRTERTRLIVGVDEVGRGPLAGPVVAAAVALPSPITGIGDSKKLSAARRRALYATIRRQAHVAVAAASVQEIDRVNILQASLLAMRRAVDRLGLMPDEILVDGNRVPDWPWPSRAIVGGDGLIAEIGAASIVAKVVRDRLMQRLAAQFPLYGWDRNVGYPTREHLEALARYGASCHHRRSFAPVRARLAGIASGLAVNAS